MIIAWITTKLSARRGASAKCTSCRRSAPRWWRCPSRSSTPSALDASLLAAVLEAKRIKSHEAKRRQMQYIGRLMREVDAAPIRAALAELEGSSAQATRAPPAPGSVARAPARATTRRSPSSPPSIPGADLQALRTLIRNARKEQQEGKPPRAYRELFRVLERD